MFFDRFDEYHEGVDRMMNEGGVFHPAIMNEPAEEVPVVKKMYIYQEGIDRLVNEGGAYTSSIEEGNEWIVDARAQELAEYQT